MDDVDGVDVVDTIFEAEVDAVNTLHVATKPLTKKGKDEWRSLFPHVVINRVI